MSTQLTKKSGFLQKRGGDQHIAFLESRPIHAGWAKVVRAVRPKALPEEKNDGIEACTEAVYALCENEMASDKYPSKIWAYFVSPKLVDGKASVEGAILPPDFTSGQKNIFGHTPTQVRPIGIAVDKLRFWIFFSHAIACVTHTAVTRCLKEKKSQPNWTVYKIPGELSAPSGFKGLIDLAACDDGTLTAVFEDKGGLGRIYTATPQFQGNQLIIEGIKIDKRNHETRTHGWVKESSDKIVARRVHKLPIFCWPAIEGLEKLVKLKA